VNPKALQAFVAVAEEGHFGKAAKRLGITQSGLSQIVKNLETTIGGRLIDRTTRSVSLTDVCEAFLDNARELLQAHRLAEEKMANVVRGEEGIVRLGFVASAALGIVPRLAALAHEHAPGLRLSLTEVTSEEQIPQLKSGDIDVGVMREIQQFPGLVIQPLETERLLVAVPNTHRLSKEETVAIAELRDEGFIMFPRTRVSYLHDLIHQLCNRAGFTPVITERAVQFATILGLVSSNAGIAIVPQALTAIRLPNVTFIPLEDDDAISKIYIARRSDEKASPAAKRLVNLATSTVPA
jgi:DNA-binding transcriptional LysR family regulator